MDEQILKILRTHKDEFISGQHLSRKLGLSSSTIAKHIHQLQAQGYDIQAQPHWGYRLVAVPDRLIAQEILWRLNCNIIGNKILSYDTCDSTNSVAFSLAEQGIPEGTCVFAEEQKKGKGRLGRSWLSPKSKGICLSVVLRPPINTDRASLLTLLAAVSCVKAIRNFCGLAAQIRWPNDILVGGKKVCGILTEMHTELEKVKFVILGIGINVNTAKEKLPPDASSLAEEAKKVHFSRIELAQQLLYQLDQEYRHWQEKGTKRLIIQWRNFSFLSGKRVKVFLAQRTIEGEAQDIDEHGALIVRLDNGFKQHIVAGDIVKIR